jgi:uroporphyrinogen decarboxylase
MNPRQRLIETLTFGRPDKIPFEPGGPRESTLAAWHQQGLPASANWRAYLFETLGIPAESTFPPADLGVDFRIIPMFEEKVLEHANGHYIVQDWMGAITEISDRFDVTYIRAAKDFVTRRWHAFPVRTRQDWLDRIRWRYTLDAPGRFPPDFSERCRLLAGRSQPLQVSISGPFWQMREWCGFEGLCLLMIEQPDFVAEMAQFWTEFISRMLDRILPHVQIDYFLINEDMAYKEHTMISPRMVRRYCMPAWQTWGRQLKSAGCAVYSVDSDGYIGELLPLWIEAGFQSCWPVEVAAGNDIVAYRSAYGRQMAYGGGIDKRALAAGGEVMRAELLRVIPPLLNEGGFMPGCDHGVPPDISWPNFVEYCRLLAQLTGWL